MDQQGILAKVAKALKRTEDRGCTPEEAASAAEFVQRLLQEHNLTLSMVGDDDAAPQARREVRRLDRRAMYRYQQALMAALAEDHFCLHRVRKILSQDTPEIARNSKRHLLIGREVNIEVTVSLYDYLCAALSDEARRAGFTLNSKEGKTFLDGAVERVGERLHARRQKAEEESRQAARPIGNGTHTELMLTDVYGSEADLNNDALNSFAPGTTVQRRREHEATMLAQQVRRAELMAAGYDLNVATYMSWGYSEETAVAMNHPSQRRGGRRGRGGRSSGWTRADENESRKRNSSSFRQGRAAGDAVGLSDQVGTGSHKRIGG
jgi:hypothetical protein